MLHPELRLARRAAAATALLCACLAATAQDFVPSPNGHRASNAEQPMTIEAVDAGVRVAALDPVRPGLDATLSLVAAGPADAVVPVRRTSPRVTGSRAEFSRGGFVEWYVNTPRGLELGLTVDGPLPGPLVFEYATGGALAPKLAEDGRSFEYRLDDSAPVFVYGQLNAHDDAGREIPASWEPILDATGAVAGLRLTLGIDGHAPPYHVAGLITRGDLESRSEPKGEPKPVPSPAAPDAAPGTDAPPTNDLCAGAENVPTAGPFPYLTGIYDITDATSTGDPPLPSCQASVVRSVWFTFTPGTSGPHTLSLCADGPTATTVDDTILAVYTSSNGGCTGTFTQVAGGCDDDGCTVEAVQSAIANLALTAGTKYFVVAYTYSGLLPIPGSTDIQLRVTAPAAAPPNDQCAGAEAIPAGSYPVSGSLAPDITNATSTGDPGAPSCQAIVSRSVWYTFTPDQTAAYEISTCAGAPTGTTVDDTVLALYTSSNGTCSGTFTPVGSACDDNGCDNEVSQAVLPSIGLTAGTKYYLLIHQSGTTAPTAGNTAVQVRIARNAPPPGNDQCPGAEVIPAGPYPALSSVTADITAATTTGDPPTPSCQANVSRSLWYRFTPAESGSYEVSTCADSPTGTTVDDTVLAVYTSSNGNCGGALTQVSGACDDNACVSETSQALISVVSLSAGTPYYILVHKFGTTPPTAGNTAVQVLVNRNPTPPANDLCSGAEVVPPAGPFPYLTSLDPNITYATDAGDPPSKPSCQPNVSRGTWYAFTPSVTGSYNLSLCADAPTGTTVDDTVLAVYTSSNGTCAGTFTQVGGACDDDSCTNEGSQSVLNGLNLAAGTTYYILAYKYSNVAPTAGNTAVQLRVDYNAPPANDTCGAATPLALDTPLAGKNQFGANNTELPAGSPCFTGLGQTASTAIGRDVVYSFTAPSAGLYSFRITGFSTSLNPVLYLAGDCPAAAPPANVTGCLEAANRNTGNGAEETDCVALSSGQAVYLYVDENTFSSGSPFTVEVNRCTRETEPNGTPATANEPACGIEGSIGTASEADFFRLGVPAASARVFALADGVAANSTDFDLRVTTSTDTLEYDDQNNDAPFGALAPNVAGTIAPAAAAYVRVSPFSVSAVSEPYRLYAVIQPPSSGATPEIEPNDAVAQATAGANEYFSGALASTADVDLFALTASAGELLVVGLDPDPTRNNTPFNPTLALLDPAGVTLRSVNDTGSLSTTASGAGNLESTTPNSPAEGLIWRVRASGTHYVRVGWSSGPAGDYLVSIAHDCRVKPATDLAVTQVDAPDPVAPGANVTYTVTVSNAGAHPASVVTLRDDLSANATLVSATPSQGSCGATVPVTCDLGTIGSGGAATVTVVAGAPGTAPATITNTARVTSATLDVVPGNDASTATTAVAGGPDGDGDGVPDAGDCAPADNTAWALPSPALDLVFPSVLDRTLLGWSPPAAPGGTAVRYDLLRSPAANNFSTPFCLAKNGTALTGSVSRRT